MPEHADAARELRRIYDGAAADLAARPELFCLRSGRCCRFREAGHELYLTRLEYDEMVARGGPPEGEAGDACPWLADGLCANRDGRALACRTYFCSDEASAAEVTERHHAAIRALHERSGLRYEYRALRVFTNERPPSSSEET